MRDASPGHEMAVPAPASRPVADAAVCTAEDANARAASASEQEREWIDRLDVPVATGASFTSPVHWIPMTHPRPAFMRASLYALPLIVAAALFGSVRKPAVVDEAVAGVLASVPDIPGGVISVANAQPQRASYPGFDTNIYPGDRAMRAWREDSLYSWVGYYLPAPCHKDDSWSGKRATLEGMGWGLAVIYVGQQTWDRTPSSFETRYRSSTRTVFQTKRIRKSVRRGGRTVTRMVSTRVPVRKVVLTPYRVPVNAMARSLEDCSTNLVTAGRGELEARDAIRRTEAEGFPRGTVVFLDIERMERTPAAMRDYYRSWVRTVLADGRYRPGIYAHTWNAERIYQDVKEAYVTAGLGVEPPFWIASGRNFSHDKLPSDVGHAFAAVWQGKLDVEQTRNGVRLPIDVNVAAVRSPSAALVD